MDNESEHKTPPHNTNIKTLFKKQVPLVEYYVYIINRMHYKLLLSLRTDPEQSIDIPILSKILSNLNLSLFNISCLLQT